MKVSLVVVHYHCAEMAVAAVDAFRGQAAELAVDLEVLVVDNGSDEAGRARLGSAADRLLDPGANLGYAGGLNLGVASSSGDVLLLANPDLLPLPGALDGLLSSLRRGAGVAGPRFYWDAERRFLLPPNERRDGISELAASLAERGAAWAERARRRWRRHARRHWRADEELPSHDLSGALLAVRRPVWQKVGPFDPGYRLYFEEVDWLLRCRRAGVRSVHQPRAEVVHHYDRSAAGEPRAATWFAESAERFAARWHGPILRRLGGWLAPRRPRRAKSGSVAAPGRPRLSAAALAGLRSRTGDGELWIELSPLERGFPAAAERLAPGTAASESPWELPAHLWEPLRPGRWRLGVVASDGRELDAAFFQHGEPGAR